MGTAPNVVGGPGLTNANYEKQLNCFTKDSEIDKCQSCNMEPLSRIPKIMSIGEIKWLRSLYDKVESLVRKCMEMPPDMYGCFCERNYPSSPHVH